MRGLLGIHLAVFLFGLSGLFGRWLGHQPTLVIVCGRTLLGALAMALFMRWRKEGLALKKKSDYFSAFFSGAILAFHWFSFFYAIQISTIALALLTYSSFPMFVMLLEPFVFSTSIKKNDLLATLTVVTGLILVMPNYDLGSNMTQGAVWGLISGLTVAVLQVVNKKKVARQSASALSFYQNFFAFLCCLPVVTLWGPPLGLSYRDVGLLMLLGVFCTGMAQALFIYGMKERSAQLASIVACLEAVYAIVLGYFIFDEGLNLRTLCGGGVIIAVTVWHGWNAEATKAKQPD